MKHKISPDEYMSRAVYNLASGSNREYLEHFIGLFSMVIKEKALEVCSNSDHSGSRTFDSGYVKGLQESIELIVNSFKKGERLHYGKTDHKQVPPKTF